MHLADLMKLHLRIALWYVNAPEKSVIKAVQSFLILYFSLSDRDVRLHDLPLSILMFFLSHLPSLHPQFCVLPFFHHIVFSFL